MVVKNMNELSERLLIPVDVSLGEPVTLEDLRGNAIAQVHVCIITYHDGCREIDFVTRN